MKRGLPWGSDFAELILHNLPSLRSLHIVLHLVIGFARCWRKSYAEKFDHTFLPLRRLRNLRVVTVAIIDDYESRYMICFVPDHTTDCGRDDVESDGLRDDTRKSWAMEIERLILQKDEGDGREVLV